MAGLRHDGSAAAVDEAIETLGEGAANEIGAVHAKAEHLKHADACKLLADAIYKKQQANREAVERDRGEKGRSISM